MSQKSSRPTPKMLGPFAAGNLAVWDDTSGTLIDGGPPGGGGGSLPVVDTTSIVEDPVDNTKEMRIDVGAVATATVRVLIMPDQNVDLAPNTGTFSAATHASRHQNGGADSIKLDDLAAPDDNTDLNASASAHGLLRKLSGVATDYLDGTGNWSTPAGSGSSGYWAPLTDGNVDETELIYASGDVVMAFVPTP